MRLPVLHLLVVVALVAMASPAAAKKKEQPPKDAGKAGAAAGAPAAAGDKPFAEWGKFTKDAEQKKGFLTYWKKRDNLYLEISKDQLNQPFLYVVSLAKGIGSNFVLGGLPLDDRMLQFERHGDRIALVHVNTWLVCAQGHAHRQGARPVHPAVRRAAVQDRERERLHKGRADRPGLDAAVRRHRSGRESEGCARERLGALRQGALAAREHEDVPGQLRVRGDAHLLPERPFAAESESVPDNRYIPLGRALLVHAPAREPDAAALGRQPRRLLPRREKDFARDDKENFWLRNIHRWRLEKKDPTAAVSEPVKPIVYYVDWTVPDKFRPWVKEGIEKWQEAFELAGLQERDPRQGPAKDDADWDPEDVRYSTIRWITSNEPSFGAIGPSASTRARVRSSTRTSCSRRACSRTTRTLPPLRRARRRSPRARCPRTRSRPAGRHEARTAVHGWAAPRRTRAMQHLSLLMDGSLEPGSPVPDAFLKTAVEWATLHEVGPRAGPAPQLPLQHEHAVRKLQDQAFTARRRPLLVGDGVPEPEHRLLAAQAGRLVHDHGRHVRRWAIRYGYTPSGASTPDADYAFARKIADESLQAGHEYSTDEDTYPADAPDPRSNIFDLGDDPLQFAKDRTAYSQRALAFAVPRGARRRQVG
jgi:hypothetical protein